MDAATPANIASHLCEMAGRQPQKPAVIAPHGRDKMGRISYVHYTFKQLHEVSDQLAWGMQIAGVYRGMRVALMAPPSLDFFALVFAIFKLGAVPVMIDPGIGVRHLGKCLQEAAPGAFIGIPKAHAARMILGWARSTATIKIAVSAHGFLGAMGLKELAALAAERNTYPMAVPEPNETAAILFTSGSTGPPKGAVYTHEIFGRQVELLKEVYGIQPGEIDLPTFPLFALFGPALGMTEILPDMDPTRPAEVNPIRILEAFHDFPISNMFGSPALINRLAGYGEPRGIQLSTLRRVISAGAPVPAKVLERFSKMLPSGVQIFTPYGATECLPVSSIGSAEILGETRHLTELGKGVCVGRAVPGLTAKIMRITDDPILTWNGSLELKPGEIGEIAVKGINATAQYFERPEATQMAKIQDRQNGGFYHRMGDVGYLDESGRLWFCGRKSHRIITQNGPMFTIPCEAVFNTHPAVYRTALVGVKIRGEVQPVICVELNASGNPQAKGEIVNQLLALAQKHPHTQAIKNFLFHPRFPVDIRHNAKIFREKLAVWAGKQLQ